MRRGLEKCKRPLCRKEDCMPIVLKSEEVGGGDNLLAENGLLLMKW
jgi:hypothetical protein